MATSFKNIKHGLGLLDIIQIGKYKGCRVDSIIEQDDDYLRYMQSQKILVFDASVMQALTDKFSTDSIDTEKSREEVKYNLETYGIAALFPDFKPEPYYFSDMEDDIPW